jgi:hypothetical protein
MPECPLRRSLMEDPERSLCACICDIAISADTSLDILLSYK